MKILFLLFQLNYAFTIGYIPLDNLKIYELEEDTKCYFVEFEMEMVILKYGFIGGGVEVNAFEKKFLKQYSPYQLEFIVNMGVRFDQIELGYYRRCVHPMFCDYWYNEYKDSGIDYEGAREEIYIKFSNKKE